MCNKCSEQRQERRFCTSCGDPNANYIEAEGEDLLLEKYHKTCECDVGHPVLRGVNALSPNDPTNPKFCPQCGESLSAAQSAAG